VRSAGSLLSRSAPAKKNMSNLRVVEIKAFIPAKDFALSKQFCLVEAGSGIAQKYGVKVTNIEERPWSICDFTLNDPSGILWRIAQNMD
jgi:hypothetical protein